MTIRYADGRLQEAVVLSEDANSIRLAVRGEDDSIELTRVNAVYWVSPDCEPVRLMFGSAPLAPAEDYDENNFICSPQLAARILRGDVLEMEEEPVKSLPAIPEFGWDLATSTIQ
jgi:hypothetical protein